MKHLIASAAHVHRSRRRGLYAGSSQNDVIGVQEVLFEERGSSRTVVLNRPKKLNALNLPMIRAIDPVLRVRATRVVTSSALTDLMQKWESDGKVKTLVMKGAGGKAFCAGGDIVAVSTAATTHSGSLASDFFREEYVLGTPICCALSCCVI